MYMIKRSEPYALIWT